MPGAPPSAGTTTPESSASAGRPAVFAAACAFSAALPSKVGSVSSGSGRPSEAAPSASTRYGASNAAISVILPALWLAMTSLPPSKRRVIGLQQCPDLQPGQFGDPGARETEHRGKVLLAKRRTLGG